MRLKWIIVTAFVAAAATAALAGETAAYIYGLVGVFAGKYESDSHTYEKLVGYYDYGQPPPVDPWEDVKTSTTDFAASPFAFAMKADTWRMSFVSMWNRHKIDSLTETRQVNNASLTASGGYILNRGYFADKRVKPYFGGFWRGNWTKAENVHNGVISNGLGPDLGALLAFDLNHSFALFTVGYHYKLYSLTGNKAADQIGDDPPVAPFYNYTYVPENQIPKNGSSFYVDAKTSLQFHRRVGVEAELRYDLDLKDSFVNGLTFAAGPSFWL